MTKTLQDYMKASDTNPFLLMGPPTHDPSWVYRDFDPMPQSLWLQLLDVIGDENIRLVGANSKQLPPAAMCRAQIEISPNGQAAWKAFLNQS